MKKNEKMRFLEFVCLFVELNRRRWSENLEWRWSLWCLCTLVKSCAWTKKSRFS